MVDRLIRMFHDKEFELSTFREMVRSFEDCEKMLSRETETRVEKNRFIEDELNVKSRKIAMPPYYP